MVVALDAGGGGGGGGVLSEPGISPAMVVAAIANTSSAVWANLLISVLQKD